MGKYVVNKSTIFKFKHLVLLIIVISIALTTFLVGNYINTIKWESRTVFTVNGEPVTVKEIMPKLAGHRAEIFEYFKNQYNVEPKKDFWYSSVTSEIPAENLKKAALDECINIKVQQILGKEKGLIDDISYSKYLKDLKEENKRRKIAVKKDQVIYGPQQYTESAYFSILFTDMTYELKKKIGDELIVSEQDIKQYYDEAVKKGNYKKVETTKIQKIALPFTANDDKSKNAAKEKAEEIRIKFANGEKFSDLSDTFEKESSIKIEFSEQIFDFKTYRDDYRPTNHEFTEKATSLSLGQVSDVFELNNNYYLVKCIEKVDEGLYSVDEVAESITQLLKEQKYNEYINNLVKKANVVIDQEVYKKLEIE